MTFTTSSLIRWTGLAAAIGGAIFAGIQPIHPADVLASVSTPEWAIIMPIKLIMCFMLLAGITGLYARQADKAGWLGLAGAALLLMTWVLQTAFIFLEAFVLPVLTTTAPAFIESVLGVVSGAPLTADVGLLPVLFGVVGVGYMLGGLLFGIATVRAGVLPRWPAILLAAAATLTPLAALLPHAVQRLAGIPVGVAFVWLGLALWAGYRATAAATRDGGAPALGVGATR